MMGCLEGSVQRATLFLRYTVQKYCIDNIPPNRGLGTFWGGRKCSILCLEITGSPGSLFLAMMYNYNILIV